MRCGAVRWMAVPVYPLGGRRGGSPGVDSGGGRRLCWQPKRRWRVAENADRIAALEEKLDALGRQLERMEAQQRELRQWLGRWLCAPENCSKAGDGQG